MNDRIVTIHKLNNDVPDPCYKTKNSAGMDLHAITPDKKPVVIPGYGSQVFKSGISSEFHDGRFYYEINSRSGLGFKHVLEAFRGIIDADYPPTEQWGILLFNRGPNPYVVNHGDAIAQAILKRYYRADNVAVRNVVREGGFGSTDER